MLRRIPLAALMLGLVGGLLLAQPTISNVWNPTGAAGTAASPFSYFRGVAVDRTTGNAWSKRVYVASSSPAKVMYWNEATWNVASTPINSPDGTFATLKADGGAWSTSPYGITVSDDGIVFLLDFGSKTIHGFPQDGSSAFVVKASDGTTNYVVTTQGRYIHSTGSFATGNLKFYIAQSGGTSGPIYRVSQSGVASENKFTEETLFNESNDGGTNYAALGNAAGNVVFVSSNGSGTGTKGLVKYTFDGATWSVAAGWPTISETVHDISFAGTDENHILVSIPGSRIFRIYSASDGTVVGGVNYGASGVAGAVGGVAGLDLTTFFAVYSNGTTSSYFELITSSPALPVQFSSMTARATAAGAEITWSTASEVDNAGFEIERRAIGDLRLSIAEYQKVGFVAGAGTSTSPREYSFTDAPAPGRYAYRLKQIDRDGSSTYYGEAEVVVGAAPEAFTLGEAYPNPFNPATTIDFTVPQDGFASLKVYNMLGAEVATLFSGQAKAGFVNRTTFDATSLTSGIYIYRLQTAGQVMAKRMMLVK